MLRTFLPSSFKETKPKQLCCMYEYICAIILPSKFEDLKISVEYDKKPQQPQQQKKTSKSQ